ncbi:hypothetical protein SAMN06295905_1356 [Devosia lucknowensis]|uniref:Uncharacterized protein n=1 Tax=Devosia lucknowensis TaxID=1096929 RepID=A0A1Y6EUG4_9HYPH|nr:hypothetical protein [Devosia lucknowensis]SMQ65946.1 hypothetical protein SAMN06295905_1356 [Devosia lucknowensis]
MSGLPFDGRLQCYLRRIAYDFAERRGIIVMGEGSCTDMAGATALFEAIDTLVLAVDTYVGEVPDTAYRRRSAGEPWIVTWQRA